MSRREQSREEWEQELWERQQNITPAERLRTAHYLAKNGDLVVPRFGRVVLGSALLVWGLQAFYSPIPHRVLLSLVLVAGGIYLTLTGFFRKRKGV